jgi:hypothetical protein
MERVELGFAIGVILCGWGFASVVHLGNLGFWFG